MKINNSQNDIFYKLFRGTLYVYKALGVLLLVVALGLVVLNFTPGLWYYIDQNAVTKDNESLVEAVKAENLTPATVAQPEVSEPVVPKLPDFNAGHPLETRLIIDKVGINAEIHQGGDGEKGLEKGVWQPDGFGNPMSSIPMLLASHRYGLLGWSNDYRTSNSFNKLPELNVGDEFSVIYQQRDFRYRVTSKYEATTLENVQADMVLYTCKYFGSPVRIVITAEKIPVQ